MDDKRVGFVGIMIHDRARSSEAVNHLLSGYAEMIVARVGLPYKERGCAVITLVVDTTPDELGALTGQLGGLSGVSVKSALSKQPSSGRDGGEEDDAC